MIKERLMLTKHYITIECDSRFRLVSDSGDVISKIAGTWIIDVWKLLPLKYQEKPQFFLTLEIDNDSAVYNVSLSDIDLNSVAGVNGQLVDDVVSHEKLDGIKNALGSKKIVFDSIQDLLSSEYCMYVKKTKEANVDENIVFVPSVLGVNFSTKNFNQFFNFRDKVFTGIDGNVVFYGFNGIRFLKKHNSYNIVVSFIFRDLDSQKQLKYVRNLYDIFSDDVIKIELFL